MKTTIYYHSSTGNSLAIARALAEGLGGAALYNVAGAAIRPVEAADRVGFVFPVIAWGVPAVMAGFLKGLKLEGNPYVFAVATCGGTPGPALKELKGLLKKSGVELSAGFVCREGANQVSTVQPGFIRFAKRLSRVRYASGQERLPEILEAVKGCRAHKPEVSNLSVNCFGGMMHGMMAMAGSKLGEADKSYTVDSRCTGCRTCERICPRNNVRLENGKPVWHHNCAMCNACIQWCPSKAIHAVGENCRYRNPAVRAEDLMVRS